MRTTLLFSFTLLLSTAACSGGGGGTMDGGETDGGSGGGSGGDAGSQRVPGGGNGLLAQNGKMVVVGVRFAPGSGTESDFLLARYLADGGLDRSFGDAGVTTTTFPSYTNPIAADAGLGVEQKGDSAYAAVLQGDKILVAGTAESQGDLNGAFALARYSADGLLDIPFAAAGRATVRIGNTGGPAHAIALRNDGKIYVAGFVGSGSLGTTNAANFGIVRFSSEGVVDTTFGGGTGVVGDFGKNEDARGIGFQSSKVVVGGGDDFTAARYNDDGTLDASFGVAGVAKSPGGFAHNFRALPDGKLLLSGSRRTTSDGPWVIKLVRYTSEGLPDATFGTAGVLETPLDNTQVSTLSLDVMADGRILTSMVGGFGTLNGVYASVARYTAAGAVDTAFGTNGVLSLQTFLPLLLGAFPPSPNHGLLLDGRLYFTSTATTASTVVLTSVAVP